MSYIMFKGTNQVTSTTFNIPIIFNNNRFVLIDRNRRRHDTQDIQSFPYTYEDGQNMCLIQDRDHSQAHPF